MYRRHRDAVKSVRAPLFSSASGSGGPVIEMASLLGSNRSSYAPLSTEDPGPSRYAFFVVNFFLFIIFLFLVCLVRKWWKRVEIEGKFGVFRVLIVRRMIGSTQFSRIVVSVSV